MATLPSRVKKKYFSFSVFRKTSGDKSVQLVENGCPKSDFPTDTVDPMGLTYNWAAFKFRDSNQIHFTVSLPSTIDFHEITS